MNKKAVLLARALRDDMGGPKGGVRIWRIVESDGTKYRVSQNESSNMMWDGGNNWTGNYYNFQDACIKFLSLVIYDTIQIRWDRLNSDETKKVRTFEGFSKSGWHTEADFLALNPNMDIKHDNSELKEVIDGYITISWLDCYCQIRTHFDHTPDGEDLKGYVLIKPCLVHNHN